MLGYRADIDGLRAVAVGSVVLFHAGVPGLSGGFVGVDVFFVISGFLIASIIRDESVAGDFSIARFYERRARRILPALLTVVAASAVAAFALLQLPQDLAQFARSARAALLFYSNFFFSRTGGYFEPDTQGEPLLHTWSLGVEEQFYLIAPLLIAPLARQAKSRQIWIMSAAIGVALIVSELVIRRADGHDFYGLHTRAFELMIGVGLAMAGPFVVRRAGLVSAAGLVLIVIAVVAYSAATPFPGLAAVVPCLGAALIIAGGQNGSTNPVTRALSSRPAVGLGKISYGLYLWHWPILVFGGMLVGGAPSAAETCAMIALSVVCATLSYRLVETPFRSTRFLATQRSVFAASAVGMAALVVPAQVLTAGNGWPERYGAETAAFVRATPIRLSTPGLCQSRGLAGSLDGVCVIGKADAERTDFAVWGDSHARMVAPTLSRLAAERGLRGVLLAPGGCPPFLLDTDANWEGRRKCVDNQVRLFKLIEREGIRHVIVAARWAGYAEGPLVARDWRDLDGLGGTVGSSDKRAAFATRMTASLQRLTALGVSVSVIGPVPEPGWNVPRQITTALIEKTNPALALPFSKFEERNAGVLAILGALDAASPTITVRYPHTLLCSAVDCRTMAQGRALYIDHNHLNAAGVSEIADILAASLPRRQSAASAPGAGTEAHSGR